MKTINYEVVVRNYGEEQLLCRSSNIEEVKEIYQKACLQNLNPRLRIDGEDVPLYQSDKMLGRPRSQLILR